MSRLTAKERDVLALVAAGHSNDSIAEQLHVTGRTVETHTGRISAKLGLQADPIGHRRGGPSVRRGWLPPESPRWRQLASPAGSRVIWPAVRTPDHRVASAERERGSTGALSS